MILESDIPALTVSDSTLHFGKYKAASGLTNLRLQPGCPRLKPADSGADLSRLPFGSSFSSPVFVFYCICINKQVAMAGDSEKALYNYASGHMSQPDKQIRLLSFHNPWTPHDNTHHYSLEVLELGRSLPPQYVAISYTWGEEFPTRRINVDGQAVDVSDNCWHALWQVQNDNNSAKIWIDPICIDQSTDQEKSTQVAMMGAISHSALSVASCLGRVNSQWITILQDALECDKSPTDFVKIAVSTILPELETYPYFDRIWVKPELILAKKIKLYAGNRTLEWTSFDRFIRPVITLMDFEPAQNQDTNTMSLPNGQSLNNSRVLAIMQHKHRLDFRVSLARDATTMVSDNILGQLHRYSKSGCKNPRDRIDALVSLTPEGDPSRRLFQADYGQSPFEFLRIVTRSLPELASTGFFDVVFVVDNILGWFGINELQREANQFFRDRLVTEVALPTPSADSTTRKQFFRLDIAEITLIHEAYEHKYKRRYEDLSSLGIVRIAIIRLEVSIAV